MRLSTMGNCVSLKIIRDGEFKSLGLLSHDADRMLVSFYQEDYLDQLVANPHISCVITTNDLLPKVPSRLAVGISPDPQADFYQIHDYLFSQTNFYGEDFELEISSGAHVHPCAYVAPKNVRIGRGSIVAPKAIILEGSIIGEDVTIGPGVVIGGEGFEPKVINEKQVIIAHAGGVWIHDRVEIQANSHVARSVYGGFTEVGEDTKIDGLVHIAHNVRIGRRCRIAACAMVAGSTIIGDDVTIGPNASISSEIRIGDGANISLGAVVTKDVREEQRVSGNFAIDHSRFISFIKSIR